MLIVESLWRHICHRYSSKRSDIDADLHGGCHREQIERVGQGALCGCRKRRAFEQALPGPLIAKSGLTGKLGDPHSSKRLRREPPVVVEFFRPFLFVQHTIRAFFIGADVGCGMKVGSAADFANPDLVARYPELESVVTSLGLQSPGLVDYTIRA